jgi:hypothetical protein
MQTGAEFGIGGAMPAVTFGNRRDLQMAVAALALLALTACSGLRSDNTRIRSARVDAENAVLIASQVPKSVLFRNEVVTLGDDGPVVCGEFNGMNRRGDWAGYTRFVHADGDLTIDGQAGFAARWREACARS